MTNNSKIAKNTIYLYFRMLIMMILGLYTSRVVLDMLGIEDYGIFNVVGGLVAMVSYINQAMSNSSVRFITYSIGDSSKYTVSKVFNTTLRTHLILALIVLVLIETIGLWFLYNKLVIPADKMVSAFWIFQFSALGTFLTIVTIPYTAIVIAKEQMSVFAYFTILDAGIKLGIAGALYLSSGNRLILYGGLLLGTQVLYMIMYLVYCFKKFDDSHIKRGMDKSLAKEIISFSGWSMVGCTAAIFNTQGLNILLNLFGGPVLNAARGIAVQVQSIVNNFATNFQTAVNPQIIKLYAQNDLSDLHSLIYRSAKFSFYLLYFISLPLILNMHAVLHWWLVEVPDNTAVFLSLILVITMLDTISNPLMKTVDATGKIRKYHLCVGGWLLLVLPVAYIMLKLHFPSYIVFVVQLAFSAVALFIRLVMVRNMINMTIKSYVQYALCPVIMVVLLSLPLSVIFSLIYISSEILKVLISCIICTISATAAIYFVGMTSSERTFVKVKLIKLFARK